MKLHRLALCVDAASIAAPSAVAPITTVPQPDTAVKVAAASIVSRMNLRLSIARACISGGSGGRSGRTRVMRGECSGGPYLSSALWHKATPPPPSRDRRPYGRRPSPCRHGDWEAPSPPIALGLGGGSL